MVVAHEDSPVFLGRRLRDHRVLLRRPRRVRRRVPHRRGRRLARPRRSAVLRRGAAVPSRLRRSSRRRLVAGARRGRRQAARRRERRRRGLRARRVDDHHGRGVRALDVRRLRPPRAVDRGRPRGRGRGRRDSRARFEVATATDFPGTGYDLVCLFDALHDMGDPVGAARRIRRRWRRTARCCWSSRTPATPSRRTSTRSGGPTTACPRSSAPRGRWPRRSGWGSARRPANAVSRRAARGRFQPGAPGHRDPVQHDPGGQTVGVAPILASTDSPRARCSPPMNTRVRGQW